MAFGLQDKCCFERASSRRKLYNGLHGSTRSSNLVVHWICARIWIDHSLHMDPIRRLCNPREDSHLSWHWFIPTECPYIPWVRVWLDTFNLINFPHFLVLWPINLDGLKISGADELVTFSPLLIAATNLNFLQAIARFLVFSSVLTFENQVESEPYFVVRKMQETKKLLSTWCTVWWLITLAFLIKNFDH